MKIDVIKKIIMDAATSELLPRYNKVCREHKIDGSLVTEADFAVQKFISKKLLEVYPGSVVLGEEMPEQEQVAALASQQPVWCLDPIDGTSNFAFGIPYFAISLALIENGKVVLGIVYDPIRDECFIATKDKVALNSTALLIPSLNLQLNQATAIIDFKRLTKTLSTRLVAETPFASQRNFGASALDWCWLALGRGHVYLHGSQNIWDYAAGQFIFEQLGGLSQTLEGENIFHCALEKRSAMGAINTELFQSWAQWLDL